MVVLQQAHDFCSCNLLAVMALVSPQQHSTYIPCLGAPCSMCWLGLLMKPSCCALCRQPGMRRPSIPAFELAFALPGAAPAPPPHTAAPMSLHASMVTDAFQTTRHAVILLAAKRVPSRCHCNTFFSPIWIFSSGFFVLAASFLHACLQPKASVSQMLQWSTVTDMRPICPMHMSIACLQRYSQRLCLRPDC